MSTDLEDTTDEFDDSNLSPALRARLMAAEDEASGGVLTSEAISEMDAAEFGALVEAAAGNSVPVSHRPDSLKSDRVWQKFLSECGVQA